MVQDKQQNLLVIPNHVAFIIDGNRRWAKQCRQTSNFGHKSGAENIENICKTCLKYGVKYLTLYCLSIENLQRSQLELSFLFTYIKHYLSIESINKFHDNNINIKIIGDVSVLPDDVGESINNAMKMQIENAKLELCLCIGYSGKNEILNATKQICEKVKNGQLNVDTIDYDEFEKCLFSHIIPDIDLMIRTGGDLRISNFLLWKLSYAELYFCEKYFPAFKEEDFVLALYNFQNRRRRYGK